MANLPVCGKCGKVLPWDVLESHKCHIKDPLPIYGKHIHTNVHTYDFNCSCDICSNIRKNKDIVCIWCGKHFSREELGNCGCRDSNKKLKTRLPQNSKGFHKDTKRVVTQVTNKSVKEYQQVNNKYSTVIPTIFISILGIIAIIIMFIAMNELLGG